jgi:hypothetical protein
MAGTLGTAILGNTLLDVLSTQDCNVATFGNQSSNLLIRLYDSNLPFADKNYIIGLCNIDNTYQRNAFYISANQSNMTRIGIGTAFPASIMEIDGVDAVRVPYGSTLERPTVAKKGQIRYNSDLDYFEGYGTGNLWSAIGSGSGGGSTWAVITSNVPGFVLSSGTFTTSCNVALKRFGNNDMSVQLYLNGQVVVKPTGGADYKINMPESIDTNSYPVPMILGEMWLLTSNTSNGAMAEYKALAKSIVGDSSFITIKYLNGTTETSLGEFNVGMNLTLHGLISYKAAVVYNPPRYDSNNVLISGTNVTWTNSLYPYPYLTAPVGGGLTMTYRQGSYRYFGDDIIHNVYVQATLDTQPGDTSLNYTLGLEWPVNLIRYTSNTIVGDLWVKVTNGGTFTSYKAYAQTSITGSNVATIRYLNGTYDLSLASIAAGSAITIQGTLTYKTEATSSLFIPTQYLPNKLYQDGEGRVALNNNGAVVRARWEVIETSNTPAMLIDQQHTTADIARFASNGNSVMTINNLGNVGIGTTTPQQKLVVEGGNAMVQGYLSASNMDMFRNRIINGDMRLQADGIQGVSGSNAMTVSSLPNWKISTGLFSPSITTQQIALSDNDQATTEQSYAVDIRPVNLPMGLAAHYPFEESLRDASGNGITMASTGSMIYVPGRVGSNALYLANEANSVASPTAAANYVTVSSSIYTFPTRFSVSIWINPTKLVSSIVKVAFSTNAGSASLSSAWSIYINTTNNVAVSIDGVGVVNGPVASINTWYHVVATYNAGSTTLYVDGVFRGTLAGTLAQNGFMLGNQGTANNNTFPGYIDDLRIYNRLLTTTEISALYNQTPFAPVLPSASGLIHHYPFDGALTNIGTAGGALTSSSSAISYAPGGLVGSQCLYLANESNVVASPTAATKYATGSYTFPAAFTVSLWTMASKLVSAVTSTIFITNTNNAPANNNLTMYFSNGTTITGGFYGGSTATTTTAYAHTWYHSAFTYNGTNTLTYYLNGSMVSSNISGTLSGSNIMLGNAGLTDTRPYAGYIDDLRIYNSVLTHEQIAALYYSTNSTYTTFQQTIDAGAMADFKWGTNGAIPVTLTTWLKNNTLSSQSFSLSVNSTGLIAHVTFENSYLDTVGQGFLTAPRVLASTTFSNSTYKVGSYALDVTANTVGSAPVARVAYTIPPVIPLPLTFSLWMRAPVTAGAASQYFFTVGSQTTWAVELFLTTSGFLTSGLSIGTANNSGTYSLALSNNTWYHICMVITPADKYIVYLNGSPVIQVSHPVSQLTPAAYSTYIGSIDVLRLGSGYQDGSTPFDGYLDDFRIYNRALTSAQVKALYDANASSTTQPTATNIVIPVRNFTYNTPSIAANSWQKIQVILPADSTGAWENRPGQPGAQLSLCLGAGSSYSNVTTESWTNNTEYIGGNTQRIHYDSNYFLMASSNSLWMTGVQLEKGNMGTPFDVRPFMIEKRMLFKEPPMCSVYLTVDKTNDVFGLVQFTAINYNPGGYYKLSGINAYHFVCPISGPYLCTVYYLAQSASTGAYARFVVNNQVKTPGAYIGPFGDYATASATIILYCNEGDRIAVHSQTMEANYGGMTISYIG